MQKLKSLLSIVIFAIVLITEARSQKGPCKLLGQGRNVLLPNPRNCSTYFKCLANGQEVLQSCRPGQAFDAATLTCSSPEKANCQLLSSRSSSSSSSSLLTARPTTMTTTTTTTTTAVVATEDDPQVECPEQTSPEENVLLANPRDCRSFFHCSYGRPHLQLCPLGLHFNGRKASCDWVHKAKCRVVDSTTPTPTTRPLQRRL
ncbi:hypothetical protein TKK_0010714 [Trichogramma kaykai]